MQDAFGKAVVKDANRFPARILVGENNRVIVHDFNGHTSEEELDNILHTFIYSVATFRDHLVNWAEPRGISKNSIMNFLRSSMDFCIVMDLHNRDKHGPPDRKGWSGKEPYLGRTRRELKLTTKAKKGSTVGLTFGLGGQVNQFGDGKSEVVVTADCLDKNGNSIGNVIDIVSRAVRHCEVTLRTFNVHNQ